MMINNNHTEAAQHFVLLIAQSDFVAVEPYLASNIKAFLVDGKLQAMWQTLEQQVGPFKQQLKASTLQMPQGQMEVVTCAFEKANLDANIMFNDASEIISFTMTPEGTLEQQIHAANELPPGIDTDQFSEQEIQIGQGAWILPGTLTIPVGEGPFRAVVLVHGSGSADRDETIPPNKPFRDIAWGLASRGIAVLRYDKRTQVYRAQMMEQVVTLTVKEEVIDDALAAIKLLRSRSEIDPQQVFLLGHSLGGYLAPRIEAADPTIAGLVILAGFARPLEDVLLDQLTYILSLTQTDPQQLNIIKQQVERVKDPQLSPATPANELPLGLSAAYWLDLRAYHLSEVAQRLKQPAFILQAESDYQVTQDDFNVWKEVFEQHQNVQFKSYPGLFHPFIPVEGGQKATPATYGVAGHVSEEVVADIAQWIGQQ